MRITVACSAQFRTPEPGTNGIGTAALDLGRLFLRAGHEVTLVAAEGSVLEGATVVPACEARLGALPYTEGAVKKATLGTKYDALLDVTHTHQAAYEDKAHSVIYHQDITPIEEHPRAVFISTHQRFRVYPGDKPARVILNHIWLPDLTTSPLYNDSVVQRDVALFLGNIVPHKGAHVAIEVAKRMGIHLWIAGKKLDGAYWAKIAPLIDGEKIVYLGPLSYDEKYRCLAQARMTIVAPNQAHTHYEETGQLVVAESAVMGTPVLSTANGGVPEYVTAEVGCCGHNIREMADLGKRVWEMKHGEPGHARIRAFGMQYFGIEAVLSEWEALLMEAAQ
jgi:glycosyltransferase involved in cell wall biosynthesis